MTTTKKIHGSPHSAHTTPNAMFAPSPIEKPRDEKILAFLANHTRAIRNSIFIVPSKSREGHSYRVDLHEEGERCVCPATKPCIHIEAARRVFAKRQAYHELTETLAQARKELSAARYADEERGPVQYDGDGAPLWIPEEDDATADYEAVKEAIRLHLLRRVYVSNPSHFVWQVWAEGEESPVTVLNNPEGLWCHCLDDDASALFKGVVTHENQRRNVYRTTGWIVDGVKDRDSWQSKTLDRVWVFERTHGVEIISCGKSELTVAVILEHC